MVNELEPLVDAHELMTHLQALYFCLTSDAALQAIHFIRKVVKTSTIRCGIVTGNVIPPELERYDNDIIIGTPLHIINALEINNVNLGYLKRIYFDDADCSFATSKVHSFIRTLNCSVVSIYQRRSKMTF